MAAKHKIKVKYRSHLPSYSFVLEIHQDTKTHMDIARLEYLDSKGREYLTSTLVLCCKKEVIPTFENFPEHLTPEVFIDHDGEHYTTEIKLPDISELFDRILIARFINNKVQISSLPIPEAPFNKKPAKLKSTSGLQVYLTKDITEKEYYEVLGPEISYSTDIDLLERLELYKDDEGISHIRGNHHKNDLYLYANTLPSLEKNVYSLSLFHPDLSSDRPAKAQDAAMEFISSLEIVTTRTASPFLSFFSDKATMVHAKKDSGIEGNISFEEDLGSYITTLNLKGIPDNIDTLELSILDDEEKTVLTRLPFSKEIKTSTPPYYLSPLAKLTLLQLNDKGLDEVLSFQLQVTKREDKEPKDLVSKHDFPEYEDLAPPSLLELSDEELEPYIEDSFLDAPFLIAEDSAPSSSTIETKDSSKMSDEELDRFIKEMSGEEFEQYLKELSGEELTRFRQFCIDKGLDVEEVDRDLREIKSSPGPEKRMIPWAEVEKHFDDILRDPIAEMSDEELEQYMEEHDVSPTLTIEKRHCYDTGLYMVRLTKEPKISFGGDKSVSKIDIEVDTSRLAEDHTIVVTSKKDACRIDFVGFPEELPSYLMHYDGKRHETTIKFRNIPESYRRFKLSVYEGTSFLEEHRVRLKDNPPPKNPIIKKEPELEQPTQPTTPPDKTTKEETLMGKSKKKQVEPTHVTSDKEESYVSVVNRRHHLPPNCIVDYIRPGSTGSKKADLTFKYTPDSSNLFRISCTVDHPNRTGSVRMEHIEYYTSGNSENPDMMRNIELAYTPAIISIISRKELTIALNKFPEDLLPFLFSSYDGEFHKMNIHFNNLDYKYHTLGLSVYQEYSQHFIVQIPMTKESPITKVTQGFTLSKDEILERYYEHNIVFAPEIEAPGFSLKKSIWLSKLKNDNLTPTSPTQTSSAPTIPAQPSVQPHQSTVQPTQSPSATTDIKIKTKISGLTYVLELIDDDASIIMEHIDNLGPEVEVNNDSETSNSFFLKLNTTKCANILCSSQDVISCYCNEGSVHKSLIEVTNVPEYIDQVWIEHTYRDKCVSEKAYPIKFNQDRFTNIFLGTVLDKDKFIIKFQKDIDEGMDFELKHVPSDLRHVPPSTSTLSKVVELAVTSKYRVSSSTPFMGGLSYTKSSTGWVSTFRFTLPPSTEEVNTKIISNGTVSQYLDLSLRRIPPQSVKSKPITPPQSASPQDTIDAIADRIYAKPNATETIPLQEHNARTSDIVNVDVCISIDRESTSLELTLDKKALMLSHFEFPDAETFSCPVRYVIKSDEELNIDSFSGRVTTERVLEGSQYFWINTLHFFVENSIKLLEAETLLNGKVIGRTRSATPALEPDLSSDIPDISSVQGATSPTPLASGTSHELIPELTPTTDLYANLTFSINRIEDEVLLKLKSDKNSPVLCSFNTADSGLFSTQVDYILKSEYKFNVTTKFSGSVSHEQIMNGDKFIWQTTIHFNVQNNTNRLSAEIMFEHSTLSHIGIPLKKNPASTASLEPVPSTEPSTYVANLPPTGPIGVATPSEKIANVVIKTTIDEQKTFLELESDVNAPMICEFNIPEQTLLTQPVEYIIKSEYKLSITNHFNGSISHEQLDQENLTTKEPTSTTTQWKTTISFDVKKNTEKVGAAIFCGAAVLSNVGFAFSNPTSPIMLADFISRGSAEGLAQFKLKVAPMEVPPLEHYIKFYKKKVSKEIPHHPFSHAIAALGKGEYTEAVQLITKGNSWINNAAKFNLFFSSLPQLHKKYHQTNLKDREKFIKELDSFPLPEKGSPTRYVLGVCREDYNTGYLTHLAKLKSKELTPNFALPRPYEAAYYLIKQNQTQQAMNITKSENLRRAKILNSNFINDLPPGVGKQNIDLNSFPHSYTFMGLNTVDIIGTNYRPDLRYFNEYLRQILDKEIEPTSSLATQSSSSNDSTPYFFSAFEALLDGDLEVALPNIFIGNTLRLSDPENLKEWERAARYHLKSSWKAGILTSIEYVDIALDLDAHKVDDALKALYKITEAKRQPKPHGDSTPKYVATYLANSGDELPDIDEPSSVDSTSSSAEQPSSLEDAQVDTPFEEPSSPEGQPSYESASTTSFLPPFLAELGFDTSALKPLPERNSAQSTPSSQRTTRSTSSPSSPTKEVTSMNNPFSNVTQSDLTRVADVVKKLIESNNKTGKTDFTREEIEALLQTSPTSNIPPCQQSATSTKPDFFKPQPPKSLTFADLPDDLGELLGNSLKSIPFVALPNQPSILVTPIQAQINGKYLSAMAQGFTQELDNDHAKNFDPKKCDQCLVAKSCEIFTYFINVLNVLTDEAENLLLDLYGTPEQENYKNCLCPKCRPDLD